MAERRRRTTLALVVLVAAATTSGCSLFGGDDDSESTSVFELEPGTCFQTPPEAKAELESLDPVDCDSDHTQEFMGEVTYETTEDSDTFPGQDALDAFAQGACAQQFESYVGVSYLDSGLYLTYLLPSARSWDKDDRAVSCFVTSAGAPLTGSVKGSGSPATPSSTPS